MYIHYYISVIYWKSRSDAGGEVANQPVHMPLILPKVPGRFYYYFGKPLEMEGILNAYLQLGMSMKNGAKNGFSFLKLMRYF